MSSRIVELLDLGQRDDRFITWETQRRQQIIYCSLPAVVELWDEGAHEGGDIEEHVVLLVECIEQRLELMIRQSDPEILACLEKLFVSQLSIMIMVIVLQGLVKLCMLLRSTLGQLVSYSLHQTNNS